MRLSLMVLMSLVSVSSFADPEEKDEKASSCDSDDFTGSGEADVLDELIEAIESDDLKRVKELLAKEDDPELLVNDIDCRGRRPLFFVASPEMLELLLGNGAILREARNVSGIYRDDLNQNPLHYLLRVTAPARLSRAPAAAHAEVRRQIEATAYFLMQVNVQDDIDGQTLRIELQRDMDGRLPVDYLDRRGFSSDFIARLTQQHVRQYARPQSATYRAAWLRTYGRVSGTNQLATVSTTKS